MPELFDPAHFDTVQFDTGGTTTNPVWSTQGYTSVSDVVIADNTNLVLDQLGAECRTLHVQAGGRLLIRQGIQTSLRAYSAATFGIKVEGSIESEDGGSLTFEGSAGQFAFDAFISGVVEANFVGGDGAIGANTDPGITFLGEGFINLRGATKTAWLRASNAPVAGATFVELESVPNNWRVGDEIVLSPTQAPNSAGGTAFYDRVSTATLLSVVGNRINFDAPIQFSHPRVNVLESVGETLFFGAEVLNLTRNIRIRGASGARSHVIMANTTMGQLLNYVEFDFMGPRTGTAPTSNGVLGRYPIHFHHATAASFNRHSSMTGCVIKRSGNGGFVQHDSDGRASDKFLLDSCLGYDVQVGPIQRFSGDPPALRSEPNFGVFWWDRSISSYNRQKTNHIHWRNCGVVKAFRTDGNPATTGGTRIHGFQLGEGRGCILEDCFVAGVSGNTNSAGINWPEAATADGDGVWELRGYNVTHNNRTSGSFAWTNDTFLTGSGTLPHLVQTTGRMVSYYNGFYGYDQGAYARSFVHIDPIAYGNGVEGYHTHAFALTDTTIAREEVRGMVVDGVNISRYGLNTHNANLNPQQGGSVLRPTLLRNWRVYRVTTARFAFEPQSFESSLGPPRGAWHDVVDCFANVSTLNAGGVRDFWMGDTLHAQSVVRVQDTLHGTIRLRPARLGRPGAVGSTDGPIAGTAGETLNTTWNAWVLTLAAPIYP
jgi:hypothetical protein